MARQRYEDVAQDTAGNVIASATITVYAAGTTTPINIYSDQAGSSKSNPFTTDSSGRFFFYADDQFADIKISKTGITTQYRYDQQFMALTSKVDESGLLATGVGLGRNRILNGAMNFDQRQEGGAYTATDPETYTLDNMRVGNHSSGVMTAQQSTTAPAGFQKSIRFTVVTQNASPNAADNVHLEIPLEGYFIADFQYGTAGARTVSLSFWIMATQTGDYSVSLMDGTNTVSNVSSINIAAINTWYLKKITFAPATIGAAWNVTNGFGLKILFDLGTGSNYATSSVDSWQSQAKWRKTGTVSFIQQAAGTSLYLGGIQLEIGSQNTPFEYVPRSLELLRLQRYYYKTFDPGVAPASNVGFVGAACYVCQYGSTVAGFGIPIRFPVEMAGAPVVTFYNPGASGSNWRNASQNANSGASSVQAVTNGKMGVLLYNPQVAGDSVGAVIGVHFVAINSLGGS